MAFFVPILGYMISSFGGGGSADLTNTILQNVLCLISTWRISSILVMETLRTLLIRVG